MASPAYYYTNTFAENTVGNTGGISSSATSFYCSVTPSALPPGYPFKLTLDPGTSVEEVVKVKSGSGTLGSPFSVTRGWDGTAQASHAQGANVIHAATAEDFSNAAQHESADNTSSTLPHNLPSAAWLATSIAVINETVISGSSTSTVTWNAIPQQYSNLLVIVSARSNNTSNFNAQCSTTINGDNGATYSYLTWLVDNTGTGLPSNIGFNQNVTNTNWDFITIAASQAGSSVQMGGGFCFIPNYSGNTTNKTFYSISGYGSGTGQRASVRVRWGFYSPNTQTGITSLTLAANVGNYVSGSFFGLYAFGG